MSKKPLSLGLKSVRPPPELPSHLRPHDSTFVQQHYIPETNNSLFNNTTPEALEIISNESKRDHLVLSDSLFYYKIFSNHSEDIEQLMNELTIYKHIMDLQKNSKYTPFVSVIGVYKLEQSDEIFEFLKNETITKPLKRKIKLKDDNGDVISDKHLYVIQTQKIPETITVDMNPTESIEIIINILEAVKEMHSLGIVHLDLHLGNILVDTRSNKVYIFDFDRSYLDADEKTILGPFDSILNPQQLEVIKKIDILKLLVHLDKNEFVKAHEFCSTTSEKPENFNTIYINYTSNEFLDQYIYNMKTIDINTINSMEIIFGNCSPSEIIDKLIKTLHPEQEGGRRYKKSLKKTSKKKTSKKRTSKKTSKKISKKKTSKKKTSKKTSKKTINKKIIQ